MLNEKEIELQKGMLQVLKDKYIQTTVNVKLHMSRGTDATELLAELEKIKEEIKGLDSETDFTDLMTLDEIAKARFLYQRNQSS